MFLSRWDALDEGLKAEQKKQDAASQQWSQFSELLQQTLTWLDAMERLLQPEHQALGGNTHEIRARLLKNKV